MVDSLDSQNCVIVKGEGLLRKLAKDVAPLSVNPSITGEVTLENDICQHVTT